MTARVKLVKDCVDADLAITRAEQALHDAKQTSDHSRIVELEDAVGVADQATYDAYQALEEYNREA